MLALILIAVGMAALIAARDRVRYIIGAELVILGAIAAAAYSGDADMAVAASAAGVAETLLLVAAAFKLRAHD